MISVNKKRFREIFEKIFLSYSNKTHIFATHQAENTAPQVINIPKKICVGSLEHVYWFTLIAMSDTRTTSATLYPRFAKMFTDNPSLFLVGTFPNDIKMTALFEKYQIALPRKQIKFFIERKQHLDIVFGGDPLAMYQGVDTIDELMEKFNTIKNEYGIKNLFPGAKRKVFTLLAMFLSEFVTEFTFKEVVPVDVWVQSIANSTNALVGTGKIDINSLEQMIRPLIADVFEKHKTKYGTASATWILGNKGCSNCHKTDMSSLCPVYNQCCGPFLRMRHPTSGKLYGRIERPANFRSRFKKIPIVVES